VLLEVRIREGLDGRALDAAGRAAVPGLVERGLVSLAAWEQGERVALTRRGRLLADLVVRELLP
jgi:oxygen-independent coproporphyrinogen-3 oxidase